MKIAIVAPVFPPYSGGIGNVAWNNARALQKLGHEIIVLTPDYGQPDIAADFKIIKIKPVLKYGNAAFVPALQKLLCEKFDIIHLHYPFFGGAEVVWKAKRGSGWKLVLHYHMDVVGAGLLGLIFRLHTKFILPKIIKAADKIIVTSFDYARHSKISKFLKQNPDKFVEVPNGVDIAEFKPKEKDYQLEKIYNLSNKKIILFVGALDKAHYFKGVNYLLQALAKLGQNVKLIIVGGGGLLNHYQMLAKKLQVDGRVIFAGKVSNADLPRHYNAADVVVLPSIDKSEAFGLVLLEGMACGKPVVASDLPGVRTVVDGAGFTTKPKNAADLAEKIKKILENDELAKKFGEQGRFKVEQKYSWEIIGEKLGNLYKSL